MNSKNKDVFISYSHADSDFVHKIAEDFTSKGLHIWLDEWDIQPGANITKTINEGLKASRYLLLFLSEDSIKSRWVEEEWTSKYNDEINKNQITVIPVLIDSVDIESLPPFIANKKIVNLSKDYEQNIEQTANYLLNEIRAFKEQRSMGSIKEILASSIGKSGRKKPLMEIKNGIFQRIEKAKDKGWGADRCLALITRELNYSFQEISNELEEINKGYKNDPSEFGALQSFLLHDDHHKIKKLKSKVEYIIAHGDDSNAILEEIILELDLLNIEDT
jgi:hypothetical protein